MKTVGLITEYNPFHNGHQYHISKAKEITGADSVIVVMSGNFVQRGTPAIMPKSVRTECALLSGADLVIELPVCYSTGSAEYFATGAVSLLDHLGCVDFICFGSECGELPPLKYAADILSHEPPEYKELLQKYLKAGDSFPRARQKALYQYLCDHSSRYPAFSIYDFEEILSNPNNILGIEYIKALNELQSTISPYTIQRTGSGYHDTHLGHVFSSASAIRQEINSIDLIKKYIPQNAFSVIEKEQNKTFPVYSNDLSLLLKTILLYESSEALTKYVDVNPELANRIYNHLNDYKNFEQFCDLLKTKELTRSRISRALLHIILRIRKEDFSDYYTNGIVFYINILGFRKDKTELLSMIKRTCDIPLLTTSAEKRSIIGYGKNMLTSDIIASNLYYSVVAEKFSTLYKNELNRQITIV